MAYAHALHEALALLNGGDCWFAAEEVAAALRDLGAKSVDAADISSMLRTGGFQNAGDLSNTTGIFTRTNGNVRLLQIKKPGETGTMLLWPQLGDRIFRRRSPLAGPLRDRVEAQLAPAAKRRAAKAVAAAAAAATGGASHAGASSSGASSSRAGPTLRARAPVALPPWATEALAPATWAFSRTSQATCRLRRLGADGETAVLVVVLTAHEDGAHVTLSVHVMDRIFEVVALDAKKNETQVHTLLAALDSATICPGIGKGEVRLRARARPEPSSWSSFLLRLLLLLLSFRSHRSGLPHETGSTRFACAPSAMAQIHGPAVHVLRRSLACAPAPSSSTRPACWRASRTGCASARTTALSSSASRANGPSGVAAHGAVMIARVSCQASARRRRP